MVNIQKIKVEMARNNMSQGGLAKKMNIHVSSLSKKMNGQVNFTIRELYDLSKILNVYLDELIEERGEYETK